MAASKSLAFCRFRLHPSPLFPLHLLLPKLSYNALRCACFPSCLFVSVWYGFIFYSIISTSVSINVRATVTPTTTTTITTTTTTTKQSPHREGTRGVSTPNPHSPTHLVQREKSSESWPSTSCHITAGSLKEDCSDDDCSYFWSWTANYKAAGNTFTVRASVCVLPPLCQTASALVDPRHAHPLPLDLSGCCRIPVHKQGGIRVLKSC